MRRPGLAYDVRSRERVRSEPSVNMDKRVVEYERKPGVAVCV